MTIKHEDWVQRVRARELRSVPIPNEHREKSLADVNVHQGNRDAVALVEAWLKRAGRYLSATSPEAGKGVLLCGPPGTGKTLLASVLANSVIRRSHISGAVHFVSMEGLNRLRLRKMEVGKMLDFAGATPGLAEEFLDLDERIQRCYDARLLVLDDIGQGNMTDYLAGLLNELLRDRYNRGLPTIITSNVDAYDWAETFRNASLGSFIFQACYVCPVEGGDARAIG